MGKKRKTWLVIAVSLVLLGAMVFAVAMTMLQWDFTKLSTAKYETTEHKISQTFRHISIVTDTADIVFAPSEAATSSVVCYELQNVKHSAKVKDETLVIALEDTRQWHEHIGIFIGSAKMTVYLPQGEYGDLSIKSTTGDVEIPKEFSFDRMDISGTTGDVTCCASALNAVKIRTTTGKICVENTSVGSLDLSVTTGKITASGVICQGDAKLTLTTGKTNLKDIECKNLVSHGNTGDIFLKNVIAAEGFSIERSTGDVSFEASDAAEIFVKTNTGDVTGTLLSEKVFVTYTDSGRADVPQTSKGGRCEIKVGTGEVELEITQ